MRCPVSSRLPYKFELLLALGVLLAATARPALAAETAPVRDARNTATIVSDTDQVAAGTPFHIGLRLQLTPGWHTYWQNPGDAGVPPDVIVTPSAGTSVGPLAFPAPSRQREGPLMTYAYTGDVLFPMTVIPGAGPVHLDVQATWLSCEKICVPEEGHFVLDLPAGTPASSEEAPLFVANAARMPVASPFEASVSPDGLLSLRGAELSAATVRDAWFIPDGDGAIDNAAEQRATIEAGAVQIALHKGAQFAAPLTGLVTLRAPGGQESVLQISASAGLSAPSTPFLHVLLFALLGGLLLNLMPCVFPILAMKAIGIARLSGSARGEVRAHALAYTLGVVATFVALGGALVGLRLAGDGAGWGFQFQSPVAVAVMAWLLFGVGLNLSGVYEIGFGRLAGAGQGLAGRSGHAGSFFTGALAVLVATPCTAPFMAAAIAAALVLPAILGLAVFAALGIGMASPYLVLAAVPGLARRLPRPGAWMRVLRGALAFPMYAAALWLLWVASLQAGDMAVLIVGGGALLLGLGAWSLGLAQRGAGRSARFGQAVALTSVLFAAFSLTQLSAAEPPNTVNHVEADRAERFSPDRLAALRAEGRPVFVNMTAAWCVTCLVNERLALSPASVRSAFAQHRVAYLKGDWTSGDPVVTRFLRDHARDGVPLYVFYPGSGNPVVLPQLLTEAEMLEVLDKLS